MQGEGLTSLLQAPNAHQKSRIGLDSQLSSKRAADKPAATRMIPHSVRQKAQAKQEEEPLFDAPAGGSSFFNLDEQPKASARVSQISKSIPSLPSYSSAPASASASAYADNGYDAQYDYDGSYNQEDEAQQEFTRTFEQAAADNDEVSHTFLLLF